MFMDAKENLINTMADRVIATHEMEVIKEFGKNPGEDVASVNLEVGGIEHVILINEKHFPELVLFLHDVMGAKNDKANIQLSKKEV